MASVKALRISTLSAAVAACAIVAAATLAKADVACNNSGECWHVSQRYTEYPSSLGIQFHDDEWRKEHEHDMRYRWMPDRDPDRGYYSEGGWRPFR